MSIDSHVRKYYFENKIIELNKLYNRRSIIGFTITVLLLTSNYKISSAIVLNCTYDLFPFHLVGAIYRCAGNISFDGDNSDKITKLDGTHQSGKRNADVQGLIIRSQDMEFFPVNIDEFFPNIIVLNFPLNSISHVSNAHLIPFPNLEFLALYSNKITSLDSNLFAGLNSLKFINFGQNNIKHVGHDFILPNFAEIYFYSNTCIDKDATTAEQITFLRFSLMINCPPTISQSRSNSTKEQVQMLKNKYLQMVMRISFLEAITDSRRCLKIEEFHQ